MLHKYIVCRQQNQQVISNFTSTTTLNECDIRMPVWNGESRECIWPVQAHCTETTVVITIIDSNDFDRLDHTNVEQNTASFRDTGVTINVPGPSWTSCSDPDWVPDIGLSIDHLLLFGGISWGQRHKEHWKQKEISKQN